MTDFATDIRALRKARGLSQQAAAQLLDVTPVTVWNWENGRSTPWAKNREAILLKLQEIQERPRSTGKIPALAAPYGKRRLIDNIGETEP